MNKASKTIAYMTVITSFFLGLFFISLIFQSSLPEVVKKQITFVEQKITKESIKEIIEQEEEDLNHIDKPERVQGIYLTATSAANPKIRQRIINLGSKEGINSVVIDIKDYSGRVLYQGGVQEVLDIDGYRDILDMEVIIQEFHDAGIYLIARQTVFQDPILSNKKPEYALKSYSGNVWRNYSGLSYTDPGNKGVWEYNIKIAKEAHRLGFDEINFDYIRYPSDGNLRNLNYNILEGKTKSDVIEDFFKYLSDNLTGTVTISADLFGYTMDYAGKDYDLDIGQKLVSTLDYFDYVCPMMYPSHYSPGHLGFANPAAYPGVVIREGLTDAAPFVTNKRAKIRPWLQAFHIGAHYDQAMIQQQVDSVNNSTTTEGWLLWNAANNYPDYVFSGVR